MKLTDTMRMTISEILEKCDVIESKFHTDDDGEIKSIEMKYRPIPSDPTKAVRSNEKVF